MHALCNAIYSTYCLRGIMYIKSEFKKISSFAHITRGWLWGSYRDVYGVWHGPRTNFNGAGGSSDW